MRLLFLFSFRGDRVGRAIQMACQNGLLGHYGRRVVPKVLLFPEVLLVVVLPPVVPEVVPLVELLLNWLTI